jgi:LacI family sucrose operon transcriptional repressor
MRPTIYDVAKLAGVSPSTAARVLRDSRKRRDSVTQKVLAAARQLGYQTNRMALALRAQESRLIGLVIPELKNPFFSAFAEELSRRAVSHNFVVISLVADTTTVMDTAQQLVEYRVRAIINAVPELVYALKLLRWEGPLIAFARSLDQSIPYIGMDDNQAGQLVGRFLVDGGHQRIVFVSESPLIPSTYPRIEGLKHVLTPLDFDLRFINHIEDISVGYVRAIIQAVRPTAIIGGSDAITLRLYSALSQLGLKIPNDVVLISFDGTYALSQFVPVPIASVVQPIGQYVEAILQALTHASETPVKSLRLPPLFHADATGHDSF